MLEATIHTKKLHPVVAHENASNVSLLNNQILAHSENVSFI